MALKGRGPGVHAIMNFRRNKQSALDARAWRDFLQTHAALLHSSGVPASIYQSRAVFEYLLMHGAVDHYADPTRFKVEELSDVERERLVEVVVRYLQAGFGDPGVNGLFGSDVGSAIRERAGELHGNGC